MSSSLFMGILAYDSQTQRLVKSDVLQLTNALMKLKKKGNPWEVINLCVQAFKKKYPKRYDSYIIRLSEVRSVQKTTQVGNKQFTGVIKDKKNDAYLAHTVDFPSWIMSLIRKVYDSKELVMDKEFFREFGRRHPEFVILKKV